MLTNFINKNVFLKQKVYSRPDFIETEFLETFTTLWNCKILKHWTKPMEETDNSNDEPTVGPDDIPVICPTKSRHVFSNLISNCQMHKLMLSSSQSFEALERLMVVLMQNKFLTISLLNEQFVSLLREEWPEVSDYDCQNNYRQFLKIEQSFQELLKNVSSLISKVASKSIDISGDKMECLFMEMLPDLF